MAKTTIRKEDENQMRVILFRGKTIDGDWAYGYYVFTPKRTGAFGQIISSVDFDRHYILTMKFNIVKEVIPETVGQYTGITDKNGTKIFEGDIVKEEYEVFVSARKKEKRTRIGYVEYSAISFCNGYYAYFWNDKEKWRGNFAIHRGCEVIGNIHDNPEFLKEGEQE